MSESAPAPRVRVPYPVRTMRSLVAHLQFEDIIGRQNLKRAVQATADVPGATRETMLKAASLIQATDAHKAYAEQIQAAAAEQPVH